MAKKRRTNRAVAAIIVTALAAAVGIPAVTRIQLRSHVVPLPDLSSQPAAVRSHLEAERRAALDDISNDAAAGAYCLALHADMFFDAAERCYEGVERRDAANWRWTYYRALILDENGGGQPFVDAMRRVTASAPDYGPAWWRLGEAEFKLGEYDAAADAWRRAMAAPEPERGPGTPVRTADIPLAAYARLGLARISLSKNDAEGARPLLEAAVAAAPRFGSAYRLLAEAEEALHRDSEARAAKLRADRLPQYAPYADPLIEALARTSRNSTFLLRQASEADLAANAAWSEFLIRRALGFDPDNPDVLAKLGRLLRTLGRNEEALDVLRAYHDKVPGDLQGLAQLGSCLSDLHQFAEAERMLRQALAGLDDAQTHYNLGVVLGATDRVGEAVEEYRKALQRDPYLFDAGNNLAAAYAREGRLADAAAELQKILAADPDNVMARANLQLIGRAVPAPPARPPARR